MKTKNMTLKWMRLNAWMSLFLCLAVVLTTVIAVPLRTVSAASEANGYIEISASDPGSYAVFYSNGAGTLTKGMYYMLTLDYKVISGTPTFRIEGNNGSKFVDISTLCTAANYQIIDEDVNGINRRSLKFRLKATAKNVTEYRIIIGAADGQTDVALLMGKPEFYRYDKTYTEPFIAEGDEKPVALTRPMTAFSAVGVSDSNENLKWNLHYAGGKQSTIVAGELTDAEYLDKFKFGKNKLALRFFEGGQNIAAEYEDKSIALDENIYQLSFQYKILSGEPDFSVFTSANGGADYTALKFLADETNAKNTRTVRFRLTEKANALKIVFGNLSDRTDVSFMVASPTLVVEETEINLISGIFEDTVRFIGTNDSNSDKMWNVRRADTEANAVSLEKILTDYFTPDPAAKKYENNAGAGNTTICYEETETAFTAGKTYAFSADFRVMAGTFTSDSICSSEDPALQIFVNGKNIKTSSEITDYTALFDLSKGKVNVTFSPKNDLKGVRILVGANTVSASGSVRIGNPRLAEISRKANGVAVYVAELIPAIYDKTVKTSAQNGYWCCAGASTDYSLTSIAENDFLPEKGIIRIEKGYSDNRVEYTDNTTVFSAGKTYRLQMNYRVYSGEPAFEIAFKQIGGAVQADYVTMSEKAAYVSKYNDDDDDYNYMRTVTFTPKQDLAMLRLVIGNASGKTGAAVTIGNVALENVEKDGSVIGENLIAEIISDYVKRNTGGEKIWNLCAADEAAIETKFPVPAGIFSRSKMITIKKDVNYNRVVYPFSAGNLKPNTSYRFEIDYKCFSGIPTFSISSDFKNSTTGYAEGIDNMTATRWMEFTTSDKPGDFNITVGNAVEAIDIHCVFANPRFYETDSAGNFVGENLIKDITEETVFDAITGGGNQSGYWNLRYSGTRDQNLSITDIPEGYFRIPVLEIKNAAGTVTQNLDLKPNTWYALAYQVKNSGSSKVQPFLKSIAGSSEQEIALQNVSENENGYYSEFQTPTAAVRAGVSFDAGTDALVAGYTIAELNSGMEPTGDNQIADAGFENCAKMPLYAKGVKAVWMFEGAGKENLAAAERAGAAFEKATPQLLVIVPGKGVQVKKTAALDPGGTYAFSVNVKYANPGYPGETGVTFEYRNSSEKWVSLSANVQEDKAEYKYTASFTLPSDAAKGENLRMVIHFDSQYTSGYVANAVITAPGSEENLIENGDFTSALIGWDISEGDLNYYTLVEFPEGYFSRTFDQSGMIVYSTNAAWTNFIQIVNLKPNTRYKVVSNRITPWETDVGNGLNTVAFQTSGKNANGDSDSAFNSYAENTWPEKTNDVFDNYKITYLYTNEEKKVLDANKNCRCYLYMINNNSSGYWGKIEMYECDEDWNATSGNILINNDFTLGLTGWNIGKAGFTYRLVEQPENFFNTYKPFDETMIMSNGTQANAEFSQTVELEKGKKYYFSGFSMNMNAAGVTPQVTYRTRDGKTATVSLDYHYDPERFFFEATFTLPDDADTTRGKMPVKVGIVNGNKGKGYFTTLRLFEEGKYVSLFKNTDFAAGLTGWDSNTNYTLVPYDQSVFVFYYDDERFDDGDWSGEGSVIGAISGTVTNQERDPIKGLTVLLKPGDLKLKTDAKGAFRFNQLKAGDYQLFFRAPNGEWIKAADVAVKGGMRSDLPYLSLETNETFIDYGEEDEDWDTDEETDNTEPSDKPTKKKAKKFGIVYGYLLDANGNPVENVTLYLGNVAKQITKKKGIFQFNEIAPGEYDLYLQDDDGATAILGTAIVKSGEGTKINLKLPAEEKNNLLLWILLIGAGVLVIAGATVAVILIVKKKRSA